MPFEIGDDYAEATEEDFLPLTQIEFIHLEEDDEMVPEHSDDGREKKRSCRGATEF